MTGPVDWGTLLWIVGAIGGAFVGGGLVIWRAVAWVGAELSKRDLAIEAESARAKLAEDMISKSLADHKLFAAEHFATEDGVGKAFEAVQKAIDRLSDRLDQVLTAQLGAAPPRRTRSGGQ